jgi:hypothetical protein
VQKPDTLTTFGQSENFQHTCLNNKYLTPDLDGQFIPAIYGRNWWLFHLILIKINFSTSKSKHTTGKMIKVFDNPYEAELPVCLPVYRLPFWPQFGIFFLSCSCTACPDSLEE